jgi:hypothetical protein
MEAVKSLLQVAEYDIKEYNGAENLDYLEYRLKFDYLSKLKKNQHYEIVLKRIEKQYECIMDFIKNIREIEFKNKELEILKSINHKLEILVECPDGPEGKKIMEEASKDFQKLSEYQSQK